MVSCVLDLINIYDMRESNSVYSPILKILIQTKKFHSFSHPENSDPDSKKRNPKNQGPFFLFCKHHFVNLSYCNPVFEKILVLNLLLTTSPVKRRYLFYPLPTYG